MRAIAKPCICQSKSLTLTSVCVHQVQQLDPERYLIEHGLICSFIVQGYDPTHSRMFEPVQFWMALVCAVHHVCLAFNTCEHFKTFIAH